jgi:uncharacterized membrane protein YgcG
VVQSVSWLSHARQHTTCNTYTVLRCTYYNLHEHCLLYLSTYLIFIRLFLYVDNNMISIHTNRRGRGAHGNKKNYPSRDPEVPRGERAPRQQQSVIASGGFTNGTSSRGGGRGSGRFVQCYYVTALCNPYCSLHDT